jgi:hypothetical protein
MAEGAADMNDLDPDFYRTAAEVPIEDDYVADLVAHLDSLVTPLESLMVDIGLQDHWQSNLGTGGYAAMLVMADRMRAVARAVEASLDAGAEHDQEDEDEDDDEDYEQ